VRYLAALPRAALPREFRRDEELPDLFRQLIPSTTHDPTPLPQLDASAAAPVAGPAPLKPQLLPHLNRPFVRSLSVRSSMRVMKRLQ